MGSGPRGEGVAEGLGMVQGKLELQDKEDMGPCVDLGLGQEPDEVRAHHASQVYMAPVCPGLTGHQWSEHYELSVAGFITFSPQ